MATGSYLDTCSTVVVRKAGSFTQRAVSQPSPAQERNCFIQAWVLGGLFHKSSTPSAGFFITFIH